MRSKTRPISNNTINAALRRIGFSNEQHTGHGFRTTPGGTLVSISGPPDPAFAKEIRAPWFVHFIVRLLSSGVRNKASRRDLKYSFLFMRANGHQLGEITRVIEADAIRPVIDRVFPFESTNEALAQVETGRAKGKVVVKMK